MQNKTFTVYQYDTKARLWVQYPPVEAMTRPGALKATRGKYGLSAGTVIISETGTPAHEADLGFMKEKGFDIIEYLPEKQAL
jgi:hypothetical protein